MIPLPSEIMMKVTALQWQSLDQIKKEYADILGDAQKCVRADVLRSVVAYRLQEQFYKKSLPDSLKELFARAVEGNLAKHAPADDLGKTTKKLYRTYKGTRYEVLLFADGTCEIEGKKLGSLSAAAKEITGTHWNGRKFFGVD